MKLFGMMALAAGALMTAGVALAESPFDGAVAARKAVMGLRGFNIGQLAGMAKGDVPYDAAAAQAAADNLLVLANINMMAMWPPGSDSTSITGTNALAAIWAEGSTIGEKAGAHTEAAKAMQAAAGVDLASLQGGMEALGGSCGGCHKEFKASQ